MSTGKIDPNPLLRHWAATCPAQTVWGLDIGGANLKAAWLDTATGQISSRHSAFALWRSPTQLADKLQQLTQAWPEPEKITITMTGEIADCFPSKASGVATIVEQCEAAFAARPAPCRYYAMSTDKSIACFLLADDARRAWTRVAASNWHAVARMWGEWLKTNRQTPGLILDLGSTTFDLTPVPGNQLPTPRSDFERIRRGELLYTGCRRSPLAAVLPTVNIDADTLPLAQELFATIGDAYLVTGDRTEEPDDCETADGRPATAYHAKQRIARLFCSDAEELPNGWITRIATAAKIAHLKAISQTIQRGLQHNPATSWCLLLGEGEALLRQAWLQSAATTTSNVAEVSRESITMIAATDVLDPAISTSMPAYAVALLSIATPVP
jgi:probable H4MPT-linked C1 transfer pathway protein